MMVLGRGWYEWLRRTPCYAKREQVVRDFARETRSAHVQRQFSLFAHRALTGLWFWMRMIIHLVDGTY